MATNGNVADLPKVLLCVSGCVQAEVTPRLIANILHHQDIGDHDLNVVATPASLKFFERAEAEAALGKKIFVDHTDSTTEFEVPHISLPEWADVVIVYPASANTIARCAHGLTDSLVANIVLSARCPVFFGPTMNDVMFENPITQRNLRILEDVGHRFIPKEPTNVFIKSTGTWVTKDYCSERMVLQVLHDLFWAESQETPARKAKKKKT